MYYKINIDETSRQNLKEETDNLFNQEEEKFKTLKECKDFLVERYTEKKIKNAIKKERIVYKDTKQGTKPIGFLISFWNKDYSHNTKSWYQTDWVTITEVREKAVFEKLKDMVK